MNSYPWFLYKAPSGPFDAQYVRRCETNFGYSPEGARAHYETMKGVPPGYLYHRKTPRKYAGDYADLGCLVVEGVVVKDGFGRDLPAHEDWVLIVIPEPPRD